MVTRAIKDSSCDLDRVRQDRAPLRVIVCCGQCGYNVDISRTRYCGG